MSSDRWVVIDPDHKNKVIWDGPFKWNGVTPWIPPTSGELRLEAEAQAHGWVYPHQVSLSEDDPERE